MIHRIFLSAIGLMLLGNCTNQQAMANTQSEETTETTTTSTTVSENSAGITSLKQGQTILFKENKTNITFKTMKEDSRCPKDVNCVWAGVATAQIDLVSQSKRPLTILLSTMDDANKGLNKSVNFEGYTYSLVTVSPELTSDKGFKATQGQYKIGLKIEKGTSENPILQRN